MACGDGMELIQDGRHGISSGVPSGCADVTETCRLFSQNKF